MSVRIDVVHIGCLSRNHYWNEKVPKRTPIATMTLLTDEGRRILVDPGLPAELVPVALDQRTGLAPDAIEAVFLTNRREAHLRGAAALPNATIWMFEREIESWAKTGGIPAWLEDRLRPAPERLTERIHIFPTPGPTEGHCSLLVASPVANILVAGDAVCGKDHFEHGAIWDKSDDKDAALDSLKEIIELADVVVPGHDNIFWARGAGMG